MRPAELEFDVYINSRNFFQVTFEENELPLDLSGYDSFEVVVLARRDNQTIVGKVPFVEEDSVFTSELTAEKTRELFSLSNNVLEYRFYLDEDKKNPEILFKAPIRVHDAFSGQVNTVAALVTKADQNVTVQVTSPAAIKPVWGEIIGTLADQTDLQSALDDKIEASDIEDFETTTQLNTRDTANRNRDNHTGTQTASTISDFQSTVSSNSDVSANTSARHNPVTIDTANGLTLTGQELSLAVATTSVAGAMSSSDKTKIDGIATNANNYTHPNHTGDVTSVGDGVTTIANQAVSNAKFRNSSAHTVVGRAGSGSGSVADITADNNTILSRSGSGNVSFNNSSTVKTILDLNNVDNTSDANKPVSTAQATAIGEAKSEALSEMPVATITRRYYAADDGATWNKPTSPHFKGVYVRARGPGGGGGASSDTNNRIGVGGSGGAACDKFIPAASLNSTESIAVGTGGPGGPAGNNDGSPGSKATSFGSHLSAGPGQGGRHGTNSPGAGVLGGVAVGGDINYDGGQAGYNDPAPQVFDDGFDYLGHGGDCGSNVTNNYSAARSTLRGSVGLIHCGWGEGRPSDFEGQRPGGDGGFPGGGGSGGWRINASQAGGNGADGYLEIEEIYIVEIE